MLSFAVEMPFDPEPYFEDDPPATVDSPRPDRYQTAAWILAAVALGAAVAYAVLAR